ncbi:PREDICTED: uncharacterized protein LOC105992149 [Dipodomys ordii]|uniref:Uncharacterized protein LOC105992149 n=1 Tax=Dipodomys ordii TaxID=10020 RepID=A0A1S3FX57_DIPOR|nr:PREDICTED: uncharacterized protein LOC105992149 [Dipodomys ordii]
MINSSLEFGMFSSAYFFLDPLLIFNSSSHSMDTTVLLQNLNEDFTNLRPYDLSSAKLSSQSVMNFLGVSPAIVNLPVTNESEKKSLSMKHGPPKYKPPVQPLSMPVTALSSSGPLSSLQCVTLPTQRVLDRSEHFSRDRVSTPSNEGTVSPRNDKRNKSETELSDTKGSETSGGSLDLKSLQELTITESDTPLLDSGSERCVIDSDSDRGISSDYDMEKYSKDSSSVIWGTDSDSEKGPRCFDSAKLLLEGKGFQIDSSFVEVLMKPEQRMVRIEECHVESGSLRHWMDSSSEKCLEDSDSEKYLLDSDNGKMDRDSGSEKFHMTLPSEKQTSEIEKSQMISDSVKCLMESDGLIDKEKVCRISASERRVTTSDTESGRMEPPTAPTVHVMKKEKHQKIGSKRYNIDSDSELSGIDSDSEKLELGSAVKYLIDTKPFQLGTTAENLWKESWSEIQALNLDFESPKKISDTGEHMRKAKTCHGSANLPRFQMGFKSDSRRSWIEPERQKSDYEYIGRRSRSRRSQYRSVRLQESSEECPDDLQSYWDNFERERLKSNSEKQTNIEKGKDKDESKDKAKPKETKFGKEGFILAEKRGRPDIEIETEKEQRIALDRERQSHESESETHRLGARKKANRPQGFWRPLSMPLPLPQRKKTEQYTIPQRDNRVSRIQLVRYMSDDKIVRFKEDSQALRNNEASQQKTESDSLNISPDPNTLTDEKPPRKMSRKVSYSKNRSQDFTGDDNFQDLWSQIDLTKLISPESFMSAVPVPSCSTTSKSVIRTKVPRESTISLPVGNQKCTKCFKEIKSSLSHICVVDSDDDSDSDHPLQLHFPSETKRSPGPKSRRHCKSSQRISLSQSQDPGSPVEIRCSVHQETPKFLHCDSCVALQKLIGSTIAATFPMDSQSTTGQHRTSPETEDNSDNDIQPSSPEKYRYKSSTKMKPLPKHEIAREDETNSEDDADVEDEADSEDEDDSNDKKDPKDKSDPDDTDPKDSNSGNSTDSNDGSDPSSGSGPTSDANSDRDDDPNEGDDPNSAPDSNIESGLNDDIHCKCSTNPEEVIYTKSAGNASRLFTDVDCENIADARSDMNPNNTPESQNAIILDCTSTSSNDMWQGNDIYFNIDFSPQSVRSIPDSLGPSKNDIGLNNISSFQNNNPDLQKDPNSYYNANSSNDTDHNKAISPNNEEDLSYDIGPTNTAGHSYKAAPNYNTYLDYVPEFIHVVFSSSVVNLNYIDRSSYVIRPNSAASTIKTTDTNNITTCTCAVPHTYSARTFYISGTTYIPRYTHFIGSSTIINPNCNTMNNHYAPYFATSSNNKSSFLLDPELEISPLSSITNTIYRHIFSFTTNRKYISIPSCFTTLKFYDPSKLGRNYAKWDSKKFGALLKDSTGSMDFTSFKYLTESKDILDAKESEIFKYFCTLQNSFGVKDTASLKFHSNPNSPLSSSGIVVEAQPSDVLKFGKSSGAVNQLFKLLDKYSGALKTEGGALGGPIEKTPKRSDKPIWRPAKGSAAAPGGGQAVKSELGLSINPGKGRAERQARGHPLSPTRGVAVNPARSYDVRFVRSRSVSPSKLPAVSPSKGRTVNPSKGRAVNPSRGRAVSPPRGRAVNPSRGYAVSPPRVQAMNPSRGRAVSPPRGRVVIPLRGRTVSPPRGYALSPPRGRAVSPAKAPAKRHSRERALSLGRGCVERKGRRCTVSPPRRHAVRPKQECALGPAFIRPPTTYEGKLILGSAIGVTVRPAEGFAEETSRNAKRSGRSSDNNEDESNSSILTDTKADGFIYLPEFRIDLAPHCRRNQLLMFQTYAPMEFIT